MQALRSQLLPRSGSHGCRWHGLCRNGDMPHFYPKHLEGFPYVGPLSYALAFSTENRAVIFKEPAVIDLVVDGERDDSSCLAFIKLAKQYSGYYYKQQSGHQLWQRYGYEHVIRNYMERALTIRYVLANPVRAGLVADPRRYHGLGSQTHTVDELMEISEYRGAYVLD